MTDISELIELAWLILSPREREKRALISSGRLLVHYTKNAKMILGSNEFRLNNARNMSDKTEIKIGRNCVNEFLREQRDSILATLDSVHPKLHEDLIDCWHNEEQAQLSQTFISCFTDHSVDDERGSEHHWKNYGNVALCIDPSFLKDEAGQLALYLVKVIYGNTQIISGLQHLFTVIQEQRSLLEQLDKNVLLSFLRHELFFISVASKSEEFCVEKEWRLVHAPFLFSSAHVQSDQQFDSVDLQNFYRLPMKMPFGTSLTVLETRNLVRKVLINTKGDSTDLDLCNDLVAQLTYHQVREARAKVAFRKD